MYQLSWINPGIQFRHDHHVSGLAPKISARQPTRPLGVYRVVMAKTKDASAFLERSPEMLQKIVETLFPRHDTRSWAPVPYGQTGRPRPVTNDELIAIAKSLSLNKFPGLDGIPTVAIKTIIEASPDIFRMAMQMCRGEFKEKWKRQILVLLPKLRQHTDLSTCWTPPENFWNGSFCRG